MGSVSSLASLGLNLALQRQAQRAQDKNLEQDKQQQLRDIMAKDTETRRQQDAALQSQLARTRARFGAANVGGTGGSADAVLAGLQQESQLEQAAQSDATSRRLALVNDTFANRQRQNLLDSTSRWLDLGSSALGVQPARRSLLN